MALPTDVHKQIAQMEERLRVVPADETPPPETVREQVRLWQEHVHQTAETIRWADAITECYAKVPEQAAPERDRVLVLVRSVRTQAFDLMQRLNPDQAWFWTEEWQKGEREADRQIAAGELTTFTTNEEFDAYLRALRPDIADL